ncbi:hypothetical protein AKJ51_02355 [candidate division MSBL1 archaeon SCGC-AAA382A20]|uniref:Uncharacterized protein n=1 Tax=candidate division MSBL1 archaeon SCGC-AAA382A20 TaxID=1698280 RepID=A0A133VKJ4_9EURY|nr:hypothetical protein AKJ51_02355 [candidate division MSBL1 archaeon SCGC-AAA382A20]
MSRGHSGWGTEAQQGEWRWAFGRLLRASGSDGFAGNSGGLFSPAMAGKTQQIQRAGGAAERLAGQVQVNGPCSAGSYAPAGSG